MMILFWIMYFFSSGLKQQAPHIGNGPQQRCMDGPWITSTRGGNQYTIELHNHLLSSTGPFGDCNDMNFQRFKWRGCLFVCLTLMIFTFTIWPGIKTGLNCYFQLSFLAHDDCRQDITVATSPPVTMPARKNLSATASLSSIKPAMTNTKNTEARLHATAKLISNSNGFVFLLYMNEAYLDMTKSWICHTEALLPDILNNTGEKANYNSPLSFLGRGVYVPYFIL